MFDNKKLKLNSSFLTKNCQKIVLELQFCSLIIVNKKLISEFPGKLKIK